MDQVRKKYASTDENLIRHGLAPTMEWLIAAALDGTTMTYGEVKLRLEQEASLSTIFATRIGLVAGSLMNKIQEVEPSAPLLNVLVVNQKDRQPSKGAGWYMATRFNNPRLKADNYKQKYPDSWRNYFDRAAAEVYQYTPAQWADLYQRVFKRKLPETEIKKQREKRQEGNEDDYGAGDQKYGSGGESEFHKALRLWVQSNPHRVRKSFLGARADTEYPLDSGDRVDATYHLADRTILLEVKSRISNLVDLRRGIYQCIKYRAVKEAMDVRTQAPVEVFLVTETELPGSIEDLLKIHDIRHYLAPKDRD